MESNGISPFAGWMREAWPRRMKGKSRGDAVSHPFSITKAVFVPQGTAVACLTWRSRQAKHHLFLLVCQMTTPSDCGRLIPHIRVEVQVRSEAATGTKTRS